MNSNHEKLVIEHLYTDYERDKEYLPHALCDVCRKILQSQGKLLLNHFTYMYYLRNYPS